MKKKYIFLFIIFLLIFCTVYIASENFLSNKVRLAFAQSSEEPNILANKDNKQEFERKILLEKKETYLDQRDKNIIEKEKKLNEREAKLTELENDINLILDKKIEQLEILKADIKASLKEKEKINSQKILDLAKLYEGATPEKAGSIIEKLDPAIAAKIFLLMNKRNAGKIWGFVNPDVAVKITKHITKSE